MAKKKSKKINKAPIIIIALIVIAAIAFFMFSGEKSNVDAASLAQCASEKNVKMYGSYTCSVCARVKQLFKEDFQYISYVECDPRGENSQTQLCLQKNIEHTPTWILEDEQGNDIKRTEGFLSFKELAEFSGCPLLEKNG